jgi:hypothetical protein
MIIKRKQNNSNGFKYVKRRKGKLKKGVVEDLLIVVEYQATWSRFDLAPIQIIIYLPSF